MLRLFAAAFLLLPVVMSFAKTHQVFPLISVTIEKSLGGDKALHFLLAFLLTLGSQYLALYYHKPLLAESKYRYYRVALVTTLLLLGCLLDEVLQGLSIYRQFDWYDFGYSALGIFGATLVYLCLLLSLRAKRDD